VLVVMLKVAVVRLLQLTERWGLRTSVLPPAGWLMQPDAYTLGYLGKP